MSAKLGRVYRLRRECHVVSHLAAVLPSADVDPAYLLRWFEYNPPSRLIENDAYPSIKTSELEKIPVQLPAIAEQRRIAAILTRLTCCAASAAPPSPSSTNCCNPYSSTCSATLSRIRKVGHGFRSVKSLNASKAATALFAWIEPRTRMSGVFSNSGRSHAVDLTLQQTRHCRMKHRSMKGWRLK